MRASQAGSGASPSATAEPAANTRPTIHVVFIVRPGAFSVHRVRSGTRGGTTDSPNPLIQPTLNVKKRSAGRHADDHIRTRRAGLERAYSVAVAVAAPAEAAAFPHLPQSPPLALAD